MVNEDFDFNSIEQPDTAVNDISSLLVDRVIKTNIPELIDNSYGRLEFTEKTVVADHTVYIFRRFIYEVEDYYHITINGIKNGKIHIDIKIRGRGVGKMFGSIRFNDKFL